MLAHYVAVALAKLRKSPFTTAANVLTLALGLACFIAAWGIASWWRSADSHHQNADRIVFIGQQVSPRGEDADRRFNPGSSHTIARYLREDEPELEHLARALPARSVAVAADERKAALDALFVDPSFLEIFDFEFLEGRGADALSQPGGVVLSRNAAERLFGDAPALGRRVLVDSAWEATVTGVIAPPRQPSFMGGDSDTSINVELLAAWSSNPASAALDAQDVWVRSTGFTFAVLPASLSVDALNARLAAFLDRRVPAGAREGVDIRLRAYPISEMTTRRLDNVLLAQSGLGLPVTGVLLGLGVLTLVVACVNYANLALAQAMTRTREVGMRKVLGAGRIQVMAQAWLEALLLSGLALAAALAALALATPFVRSWTGVDLLFFLVQGPGPACLAAALTVLVALVAGAYPALVLSGLRPAQALTSGRSRTGPRAVMRLLVGIQFASASFLLILVAVTQLQRSHLEAVALGSHEDQLIVLNNMSRLAVDQDLLADRLAGLPGVRSVSFVNREPWSPGRNVVSLARSADPAAATRPGYMKIVRPGYFETLELDVLAGRVFDPAFESGPRPFSDDPEDDQRMVVDRTYAERLGFETPAAAVDQIVYIPDAPAIPLRIIGVVETETTRLEASDVAGHTYFYAPWGTSAGQYPLIRIAPDAVASTVAAITAVWDELAPSVPIDVRFFDELFERSFATYASVNQIFSLLAGSAFLIASIGQLGIAVNIASRRRHEIGVRKTLGSTTLGIVRLLLIDFSKPALLANLAAWPLGYLAAQAYLAAFTERVPLTPAPFALSLAITLAIAWAAVIGEVLKAASVRPVEVLRHA